MPKICYVPKDFSAAHLEIIEAANRILTEYDRQGYSLTLRQLYYQFVARGLIANKQSEYKRLGSIINDARLAGEIDWKLIEDRTRNLKVQAHWDDERSILEACANQFSVSRWDNQENYVEVWIEKDALVGVIEGICKEYDIPYFACRGYSSQSEQWRAGIRLRKKIDEDKNVIVLHLGDHDPSGLDMTRDNDERLLMFADSPFFEVRRLALNMDQVEHYNPPPNPAKTTDSRHRQYVMEFGHDSWELDALEPRVINALIEDELTELIDIDAWEETQLRQDQGRERLTNMVARYDELYGD